MASSNVSSDVTVETEEVVAEPGDETARSRVTSPLAGFTAFSAQLTSRESVVATSAGVTLQ